MDVKFVCQALGLVEDLLEAPVGSRLLDIGPRQTQPLGDSLEGVVAELVLMLKQGLVRLPKARRVFLGLRHTRQHSRRHRSVVEWQRIVLPHDAKVFAVLLFERPQRSFDGLAEWTLEVAEEDQ